MHRTYCFLFYLLFLLKRSRAIMNDPGSLVHILLRSFPEFSAIFKPHESASHRITLYITISLTKAHRFLLIHIRTSENKKLMETIRNSVLGFTRIRMTSRLKKIVSPCFSVYCIVLWVDPFNQWTIRSSLLIDDSLGRSVTSASTCLLSTLLLSNHIYPHITSSLSILRIP
jgi:hypothetical protein